MVITALYAAFLTLFYLVLSANVSRLRLKHRISLGAGELPKLERAMRAHGNFIEYVPLILILMGLLESLGGSAIALHLIGSFLFIARLSHASCLCVKYVAILRQVGALITYVLLFLSAVMVLLAAL
ncbi:MAG TPA: hypothetical protein DD412_05740 [Holosporales bacterium]|nr:hypothetical protein [Holosporales bacterium]